MTRHLYLVCYDVSDPSTLRRIHKLVAGYAIGGQKSFYECWMTQSELQNLEHSVRTKIDIQTDRCHIFRLDPRSQPLYLGTAKRQSIRPFLIL